MQYFICALRDNFSSFGYSGCVAAISKNGIEVSHLFFSNLLTVPYENIVKIIQFKNKWIDLKMEYYNGLKKIEIVYLRVTRKKAFISYAIQLGIEIETQEKFKRE